MPGGCVVAACEAPTVARDVSTPYLGRLGEEGYLAAVAVNCPVLVNCDARSWHSLASRPGGWGAQRARAAAPPRTARPPGRRGGRQRSAWPARWLSRSRASR